MNKKIVSYILSLVIISNMTYANMDEDISRLNNLFAKKEYSIALTESKKFIKEYPESKYNKDLTMRIAKIYFLSKNYSEANVYFKRLANDFKLKRSEKYDVYSYLYKISRLFGNSDSQLIYEEVLSKNKKIYEEALFETGKLMIENEKNIDAIEDLSKAIHLKKNNYNESYLYSSLAYLNLKDYKSSYDYLANYYNLKSKDKEKDIPLVNYILGTINYKKSDIEEAIKIFEAGINDFPNDEYTNKGKVSLIEIYLKKSDVIDATKVYESIVGVDFIDSASKVFGDYFLKKEQFKNAISYYEKIGRPNEESTYNYAYSLYKNGEYLKSISEFKKINNKKYNKNKTYYIILSLDKLKEAQDVLSFENKLNDYLTDSKKYNDLRIVFADNNYAIKNLDKTLEYYKAIYKDYPEPKNIKNLILLNCEIKSGDEIEKLFSEYKSKYSDDEEYKKIIYISIGDYYLLTNSIQKLENLYIEYLEKNKDEEISSKLVDLFINQKKYVEAIRYLETLDKNPTNDYLKGIAYMGIADYEKADSFLSPLLEEKNINPNFLEKIKYNQIKNYFLWEKYDSTIELGIKFLEENNSYSQEDIIDRIALSYYRKWDFESSRKYFNKLINFDMKYSYGKFQIAKTYFEEKDFEKALELFKEIPTDEKIKGYKEDSKYWETLCYLELKDEALYLESSKLFIEEYPNSAYIKNIMMERAKIYSIKNDDKMALKEYLGLYELQGLDREKDETAEKIINIYKRSNNEEERVKWINKIKEEDKKSYNLSVYYREKGKSSEALVEESKLLKSEKYKDYALINLADDNFKNENYVEAQKSYKEIVDMETSLYKAEAIFKLGSIYKLEKKYAEAQKELTKIVVLYPKDKNIILAKLQLSEIFETNGELDKAIVAYKELYDNPKADSYIEYLTEKLLILNLRKENMEEAKKLHKKLLELNEASAKKYEEFLVEKTEENITTEGETK